MSICLRAMLVYDAMSLHLGEFKMLPVVFGNKHFTETDVFLYTKYDLIYAHQNKTSYKT